MHSRKSHYLAEAKKNRHQLYFFYFIFFVFYFHTVLYLYGLDFPINGLTVLCHLLIRSGNHSPYNQEQNRHGVFSRTVKHIQCESKVADMVQTRRAFTVNRLFFFPCSVLDPDFFIFYSLIWWSRLQNVDYWTSSGDLINADLTEGCV